MSWFPKWSYLQGSLLDFQKSAEKYEVKSRSSSISHNAPGEDVPETKGDHFRTQFELIAGADGEIDAFELQQILNETFKAGNTGLLMHLGYYTEQ